MPSPFPGMDPYIEMFEWEDFHTTYVTILREELKPRLPAGYAARVERRSYVELDVEYSPWESATVASQMIVPDLAITRKPSAQEFAQATTTSTAVLAEPLHQRLPDRVELERRETYVEIRDLQSGTVITAIEMLSPTNKRAGTVGGRVYAEKRLDVLASQSHFVELDLLRRGQRILLAEPGLPPGQDYYAFVSRADERPQIELYSWRLRDPLPRIGIPLKPEHGHVSLDLQRAFDLTCARAGYEDTLDYRVPVVPPVRSADENWLRSVLQTVVPAAE